MLVVFNPCVLSANRVDFGLFFLFHKFSNFTPPPPQTQSAMNTSHQTQTTRGLSERDARNSPSTFGQTEGENKIRERYDTETLGLLSVFLFAERYDGKREIG